MLQQQGQGMHGRFGRDNTRNFMAATGPDFKAQYRDPMPASNAGITPTLLRLLGWQSRGRRPTVGAAPSSISVTADVSTWTRLPCASSYSRKGQDVPDAELVLVSP